MRHRTIILPIVATLVLAAGGVAFEKAAANPVPLATTAHWRLTRTMNGLLFSDPFAKPAADRVLQDRYEFNGDLSPDHAFVHATRRGLRVGVQPPPTAGDFTGWFAVTLDAFPKTSVFHVRVTKPPGNVDGAGQEAEAVFAVQTASTKVTGLINFVEVTSDSLHGQTAWQLDYSWGKVRDAKTRLYWRTEPTSAAPGTEDVTVSTDGSHTLTVWLGHRRIFQSDQLHLDMEAPLQPYLEVQALRVPYVATFQDFWVTRDATLTVTGAQAGDVVSLDTPDGVLAHGTVGRDGTVALPLPPYSADGTGTLIVDSLTGAETRLGPVAYAGGDTFHLARR